MKITHSSFRLFRPWNSSGCNSVMLLSCNHLCWGRETGSFVSHLDICFMRSSFIKVVYYRLVVKPLDGKGDKGKNKQQRMERIKGGAAVFWESNFIKQLHNLIHERKKCFVVKYFASENISMDPVCNKPFRRGASCEFSHPLATKDFIFDYPFQNLSSSIHLFLFHVTSKLIIQITIRLIKANQSEEFKYNYFRGRGISSNALLIESLTVPLSLSSFWTHFHLVLSGHCHSGVCVFYRM